MKLNNGEVILDDGYDPNDDYDIFEVRYVALIEKPDGKREQRSELVSTIPVLREVAKMLPVVENIDNAHKEIDPLYDKIDEIKRGVEEYKPEQYVKEEVFEHNGKYKIVLRVTDDEVLVTPYKWSRQEFERDFVSGDEMNWGTYSKTETDFFEISNADVPTEGLEIMDKFKDLGNMIFPEIKNRYDTYYRMRDERMKDTDALYNKINELRQYITEQEDIVNKNKIDIPIMRAIRMIVEEKTGSRSDLTIVKYCANALKNKNI